MNRDFQALAQDAGIIFPDAKGWLSRTSGGRIAMDAQPTLITTSNAGIPSWLSTQIDPKLIEILVTPMKAAEILGEGKKGDWTTQTWMFPIVESTGETTAYNDYNEGGVTGVNVQYESRQSFLYQTFTRWGEHELDVAGLSKIDLAARLNIASALTLNKFQNKTYFYGVAGLQNYGLLNDPTLTAALTPGTKTAGGTGWANATPEEILKDIQKLFIQLVTQTGGNVGSSGSVEQTDDLTLALHPTSAAYLNNANSFGRSAWDQILKAYPKLTVIPAIEYLSGTTYSAQLIVKEVQGQSTGYAAFNEKMRAHPVIIESSSFKQKKTGGTWGAIITYPAGIAQMAGI